MYEDIVANVTFAIRFPITAFGNEALSDNDLLDVRLTKVVFKKNSALAPLIRKFCGDYSGTNALA